MDKRIYIRVPEQLLKEFDRACKANYTTKSEVLRRAMLEYVRETKKEDVKLGEQGLYEHGPNDVVEVVVLETTIAHTEPIERFRLVVPSGDEKSAVKEAIAEVEARGYTVIADDQGGCNEYVSVTDGEDYIAVTVAPNAE